jgi:hypothetical protein
MWREVLLIQKEGPQDRAWAWAIQKNFDQLQSKKHSMHVI